MTDFVYKALEARLEAISANHLVEIDDPDTGGVRAYMPNVEIEYRPPSLYDPPKFYLTVHRTEYEGNSLDEVLTKAGG